MAVAFDEAGQQHLVLEAVVDFAAAEAGDLVEAADGNDPSLAHCHMGGGRPRRVHGHDLAGGENNRILSQMTILKFRHGSVRLVAALKQRQIGCTNGASDLRWLNGGLARLLLCFEVGFESELE